MKTMYDEKYNGVPHIQLRIECTNKDKEISFLKADIKKRNKIIDSTITRMNEQRDELLTEIESLKKKLQDETEWINAGIISDTWIAETSGEEKIRNYAFNCVLITKNRNNPANDYINDLKPTKDLDKVKKEC